MNTTRNDTQDNIQTDNMNATSEERTDQKSTTPGGSRNNKEAVIAKHSELIPRLYMKLLPIQIILVIISGLNAVIDNTFAANLLGAEAMAITGLFCPVTNLLNGVNALFFGGAQVLCGKYLGKRMAEKTRSIFSLDVISIIVISLILTLLCEIFPHELAPMLGARGSLIPGLAMYIRGYALGLPFFCLGTQFTAFLQLEHKEKLSYTSILSMFFVNAFLNWFFISSLGMGLFGLGLSTSVSNLLFFAIQGSWYLSGKSSLRFEIKNVVFSDLRDILINGLPGAIAQFCIFIRGTVINRVIAYFIGETGLSAFSAVQSFGCVYWAVPAGVTSAVMVLGSVYVGEEDKDGLKVLMKTFLQRGIVLVLAVSLILSACCYPLTNIFFHDPSSDVFRMTLQGFLLFPLFSPFSSFTVGLSNYFHCQYHERIVRIVSLLDGLVSVCVLTVILAPAFGMTGVWVAQILGNLFNNLVLLIFSAIYNFRHPDAERIMCFPDGFGVPDEDRLDISVHSMEEVVNISALVWDFCESHGVDTRRTNCSSLCVEELAGNIIKHGFSDGKKHILDIRVSCIRDDVVICLKDDCKSFDPAETARLFDPEDISHNIGLRIASSISKSMNYMNTFGLNILTVTL